ncbi:MAG: PIN domain-containing protein [Propionibacteriales bacterium]|nr:PIN domain-containing protein [Propionibacteriales bacterium]
MPSKKVVQPLVYVDTCVYLDLVTRNKDTHAETGEERWKSAKAIFDAVNENDVRLASSSLVEAEVCCNGEARREKQRTRDLLDGWFTARSTQWAEVDRYLARESVRLINLWQGKGEVGKRMSPADALHLAAALRLGADYFMTHDGGFPLGHRVDGVFVMRPDVVWQESLLKHASGE